MPDPTPAAPEATSASAGRLLAALAAESAPAGHATRRRALSAARKAWLTRSDPAVEYQIGGTTLAMPLSHQLPVHQAAHPDYSMNLGRIAGLVATHHDGATIVDIGANVGDSVAIMRTATSAPILCVEGDEQYLPYLRVNARRFRDVEIAPTYVRTAGASGATLTVVRDGGTARLESTSSGTSGGGSVEVTPLADLLERHDRFTAPALIKVDTDGQDAGILADAADLLAEHHPTLFFEFDPEMTRAASGGDALEIFPGLARAGYRRALFFTNLGDLVLGLDVDAWDEVPTLAELAATGEPVAYFDVCAFGPGDDELARSVERTERDHRARRRATN